MNIKFIKGENGAYFCLEFFYGKLTLYMNKRSYFAAEVNDRHFKENKEDVLFTLNRYWL